MSRVLGLGGVFFKSDDPEKLGAWYREWLGVPVDQYGAVLKYDNLPANGYNVWSPFKRDTKYIDHSEKEFMFNFIVDDVKGVLKKAEEGGAQIMPDIEDSEYGTFGWFIDPEGNKVELWEPPEKPPST